jgi:hypothetical protein
MSKVNHRKNREKNPIESIIAERDWVRARKSDTYFELKNTEKINSFKSGKKSENSSESGSGQSLEKPPIRCAKSSLTVFGFRDGTTGADSRTLRPKVLRELSRLADSRSQAVVQAVVVKVRGYRSSN